MSSESAVWLFSYGTLQLRDVQLAVFGRELTSEPDALCGFVEKTVLIDDPTVVGLSGYETHLILHATGDPADRVAGAALAVTEADLPRADDYETAAYVRVAVSLDSGRRAWVYVAPAAG